LALKFYFDTHIARAVAIQLRSRDNEAEHAGAIDYQTEIENTVIFF